MIGSRQETKNEMKRAPGAANPHGSTTNAGASIPNTVPHDSARATSTNGYSAPETKPKNTESVVPTAVIGPKIRFKGELVGEEDLLVQGTVEGTIDLKNNNLTIGKQGVIKANAKAKTIIIEGRVDGDLHGEERIVIKESSNVSGNIVAERVSLEDGAKFKGSIDMDVKSSEGKPNQLNAKTPVDK